MIFIKRSLRPLDDCFLKLLVRTLETFKKVVTKITANPFERFCRSLDFFAYPFKPLANPLKALEKPLTSRWLAVSFYPFNGKPLVYVFLEKVTNRFSDTNKIMGCRTFFSETKLKWLKYIKFFQITVEAMIGSFLKQFTEVGKYSNWSIIVFVKS